MPASAPCHPRFHEWHDPCRWQHQLVVANPAEIYAVTSEPALVFYPETLAAEALGRGPTPLLRRPHPLASRSRQAVSGAAYPAPQRYALTSQPSWLASCQAEARSPAGTASADRGAGARLSDLRQLSSLPRVVPEERNSTTLIAPWSPGITRLHKCSSNRGL
jgi:hypothetical protein